MFIQYVKFSSDITESEFLAMAEKRKPEFNRIKGLEQKYFVKNPQTGEYGGIYIWKDEMDMKKYKQSSLAKSTSSAYKVDGVAQIEELRIITLLRNQ